MNIEGTANQILAVCNRNNNEESIRRFIASKLEQVYTQGCTDQKHACKMTLVAMTPITQDDKDNPLISWHQAIGAVMKSTPTPNAKDEQGGEG